MHRGLRTNEIKENTLEAFQNAIASPFTDGFEFDIRKTKDQQFVVHHNAFIKNDLIRTKTYKYLKQNYHLPLLSEVLSLKTDKLMLVEIKDSDIPYERLMQILESFPDKKIYVMSFHNEVIKKLKELGLTKKVGVLNYILNSEENLYDFICLLNNFTTKKLIEAYQNRKVEVFLYGVINEEEDLKWENVYYIVDKIPRKKKF